jgi:lipoate-protein ligase A
MAEDGAGSATWNMALDEALLEAVIANEAPPTLRLYQWERHAVSLGRFQSVERTLNREEFAFRGIPLVRRITGGRGILHGDDLTISIIAPVEALGFEKGSAPSVSALYIRLAAGFLRAFAELGIVATMGDCCRERNLDIGGDCFAVTSRVDIIEAATGRKLIGTALHRREHGFLQQSSLPLHAILSMAHRTAHAALSQALFKGQAADESAMSWPSYDLEAIRAAIRIGFETALGTSLTPGAATHTEREQAQKWIAQRYADPVWTEHGSRSAKERELDH